MIVRSCLFWWICWSCV